MSRLGAPHLPVSVSQIYAMIHASVWNAVKLLWTTTWHAIVVWGLGAPVLVALIYVILIPLLRRLLRRQIREARTAEAP